MVNFPTIKRIISIHKVFVSDQDHTTYSITHPKHLPLFGSPLASEKSREEFAQHEHEHKEVHCQIEEHNGSHTPSLHQPMEVDPDEPVLKQAHEASTIQLFYDLFFVANLTTFTNIHEIDDADTLKSYVGFFGVLWFTWLQVALFDVRFSNDSAFERLCKALQFGVMTGMAVVGPGYRTGWDENSKDADKALRAFQTLSFILMASRLILAAQYGVVYWWLRSYRKAYVPLIAHIGTLLVAAVIYLGLYFSFTRKSGGHSLIAWYVTLVFEAIVILLVSGRTRFLNFKSSALAERLGLLTLIILGEGIIGMCGSIRKVGADEALNAQVIGMIICSVGTIYFLWMLYFDQQDRGRVGTIRQQIWTLLHFPFHVCILLVVEGQAQLSVWVKFLGNLSPYFDAFTPIFAAADSGIVPTGEAHSQTVTAITGQFQVLQENFANSTWIFPDVNEYFRQLNESSSSPNISQYRSAVQELFAAGVTYIGTNFQIKPPEETIKHAESQAELVNGIVDVFHTVFLYFLVAAGFTLILLAALFMLSNRRKLRGEILSAGVRTLVGIGLILLNLMNLPTLVNNLPEDQISTRDKFLYSPWILPTVLLSYFIVVLLDAILINYAVKFVHSHQTNVKV